MCSRHMLVISCKIINAFTSKIKASFLVQIDSKLFFHSCIYVHTIKVDLFQLTQSLFYQKQIRSKFNQHSLQKFDFMMNFDEGSRSSSEIINIKVIIFHVNFCMIFFYSDFKTLNLTFRGAPYFKSFSIGNIIYRLWPFVI